MFPARRPTRGSGLGAAIDPLAAGAGAPFDIDDVWGEHAAVMRSAIAAFSDVRRARKTVAIATFLQDDDELRANSHK
jgi:hypothetical protein